MNDEEREQHQNQRLHDDVRGNNTGDDDEQRRFGGQVRKTTQGKRSRDRVDPESKRPLNQDRDTGDTTTSNDNSNPDWQRGSGDDTRLYQSAADTDLDSNIERGV